jgi:23S rRNA pseudouridine955/2504/2580 synthase
LSDGAVIKLSAPATREFWELPVLFEDEQVLALAKPAGMPSSPPPQAPGATEPAKPNLLDLLHQGIAAGKPWAAERQLTYLMLSHRLETEVSGAILLARNKPALVNLANSFGAEKPIHEFLALVQGAPETDEFELEAKLAPDPAREGFFRVDSRNGKRARTQFRVRERFDGWTLLSCVPLTHRPYQIQAHLRYAHLPLAGDTDYGGQPLRLSQLKRSYRLKPNRTERPLTSRPALHSEILRVPHPVTGEPLPITAPWPKELTVAVKYLRLYARS